MRDIKGPVDFPFNAVPLIVLAALLLTGAVVFLGMLLVKKMKARKQESGLPAKHADQLAYEALEELWKRGLPAEGRIKEFFFELSAIIRHYIEGRFNLKAPEMTTEEFLNTLKASDALEARHKDLLKGFLSLSDIVKFARYGPAQEEITGSYEAAKRFVDDTRRQDLDITEGKAA